MGEFGDDALNKHDIASQNALTSAVGYALMQFTLLEESNTALFAVAAGISTVRAAFRIQDAIRDFSYRVATTDAAMKAWLIERAESESKAKIAAEWKSLNSRLIDDGSSRNGIAHFRIVPDGGPVGRTNWVVCPYFQPFSWVREIQSMPGRDFRVPDGVKKLDLDGVIGKMKRFEETQKRIDALINFMCKNGAVLPRDPRYVPEIE